VTVNLYSSNGTLVGTTTTSGGGAYLFTGLTPGDYFVEFIPPAGYTFSSPDQGGNDATDSDANTTSGRTITTTLTAGENDLTWDAGLYQPASLGDKVWSDLNANGVQDGGAETGIDGVTVNLYRPGYGPDGISGNADDGDIVETTTTSGGGLYLFDNLIPGDYYVDFIPPAGYVLSPQDQGGNDAADSDANPVNGQTVTTTLTAGETDLTWDAGLYQSASLGDFVWNDLDADGVQDGGPETGIDGVTVNLYASDGTFIATTTTSAGGYYLFTNLTPGDYYVDFIPPAGYVLSPQDQGGNDVTDSDANPTNGQTITTTITAGENDLTWDAGLYQLASLGDIVWNDLNANGVQDGGAETGINGVTVNLYSSTGTLISTTTTAGGGLYLFDNLIPGDYYVEFIPPAGYVVSPQDQGGNDVTDSDVNAATGRTITTTLVAGENDLTWDAGLHQQSPSGLTKIITGTSLPSTTGTNTAIGEIVTYQVNVTIPPGTYTTATLVDTMERGLAFVACDSINAPALTTDVAGSFTAVCSTPTTSDAGGGTTVDVDRRVTYNFGTLTNSGQTDATLTITYRAIVLDIAANINGNILNNSVTWNWSGGSIGPAQTTVNVVEPKLTITKTANVNFIANGSEVTFTLTVSHTQASNSDAFDVVITDVLPTGLSYVANSLDCTSGAQDPDVQCVFDNTNPAQPTIRAEWSVFTRNGGTGSIRFRVVGNASIPQNGVTNIANVEWTSLPGIQRTPLSFTPNVFSTERYYDPGDTVNIYGTRSSLRLPRLGGGGGGGGGNNNPPQVGGFLIPITGFAPNTVTALNSVARPVYGTTSVVIEIPSIKVDAPIVGVQLKDGGWDVSWLTDQAGWLEGTAYPTWDGNSVLTAHVVNADGKPGLFANLNKVKTGDYIFLYQSGYRYTYQIVSNGYVQPNDINVLRHEEKATITLVTCDKYDEKAGTYLRRVVVRAVLVDVSTVK
jgi:LPXTG-site transpeptidase (sortase) family protein